MFNNGHDILFASFFFFNDTATTEIYTLSLHDALPISIQDRAHVRCVRPVRCRRRGPDKRDRKSTRLNSSHVSISYAVFCLKKKKKSCCGKSMSRRASTLCSGENS